ncbi:LOW QUALITY PROTEIN: muscle M-line assembly protein unc-89-like [Macrobrachium rosenbergii]|uniref:LOW QUALITY PROTEIN: muscle M-line assembly protein unc-89-like n=1 Tax=Macrobrachium rosenbergii TaxID=79674 RepID=UPI0034D53E5C
MSHKYVSNKAVLQDKTFLNKLGATLAGRSNPDPNLEIKEKTTLSWRKTSQVRRRIKTATGTIPIYDYMTPEEEAAIEAEAMLMSGGGEEICGEAAVAVETAAIQAGLTQEKSETKTVTKVSYTVLDNYKPDDIEGLEVVAGQTVELIDKSSPHKRPRLEGDEETAELLDNSAARHKMAIRPKRNHPDPRSRAHDVAEERWLVKDPESGKQGLVPAASLEFHKEETVTEEVTSLKRSLQHMVMQETLAVKKNLMKEIKEMKSRKLSSKLLGPSPEDEARGKRKATIQELIETEEEFVKDLQFVMEHYFSLMDKPTTPRAVRDHKDLIFNNFKFIADFHQSVLIEGVKYHAEVPTMVGRTFLRLERDFDKHAEYCSNEPLAQEFIANNLTVKEFFDEFSQKLGDDKNLQEHLKLPIQRLNDYQLLLKELVKFTSRLGEETNDLEKAYELMQTIPQRATDAKFITSIEGFKGNLFKLGRLIRHDWFNVREAGQKPRERYLFLFKARILITKVKRISEDRSVFILKDIIRLPETSLAPPGNPKAIEFFHIESLTHPNFPILIEARTPEIKEAWLQGIKEYVVDTASVEDLLFDDELRVVSQDIDEEDAGVISPVPEVQDFEDLPEDGEAAPVPLGGIGGFPPPSEQVEEHKLLAEQKKQQHPPTTGQPAPKASSDQETTTILQLEGEQEATNLLLLSAEAKDAAGDQKEYPEEKSWFIAETEGSDGQRKDDPWDQDSDSVPTKRMRLETASERDDYSEGETRDDDDEMFEEEFQKLVARGDGTAFAKEQSLQAEFTETSEETIEEEAGHTEEQMRVRGEQIYKEKLRDSQEEMIPESPQVIDIWGDRDTSPPLRIQLIAKPEEETAIEPESEVVEGKEDKLQTQISEEMARETKEEEIDIWGDRDTSPPLRIQPIAKPEEETAIEPESKVVEGKGDKLQTQISEEMARETKEEEIDIWGDRDTSPPLRIQLIAKPEEDTAIGPEYEVVDGKEDKLQTLVSEEMAHETKEVEIDIWGDRDTSPPLRIQPIAKPDEETAIGPESEVIEGKANKLQTQISEEVAHESKQEIDIWGDRDTSPPLRIQPIAKTEEETAIEPESEVVEGKLDKLQTQISEEMAHETKEEIIDIWGDRDTSPPLRIQPIAKPEEEIAIEPESEVVEGKLDKLQTQISEEMAHETKEEIIDIWGDRDTSPPLRIQPIAKPEEEIAIEPESEVVEGKLDKLQTQISEEMAHETKEEIIDIWGGRDTSPPLRIQPIAKPEEEIAIEPESEVVEGKLDKLQTQISEEMAHETIEEEIDIWGDRDTSPPLRIQPIAKPEEEIAIEPESEVVEGKLDKLQTQISEEMAHETKEEIIDIWGDRDTSPPLRIQPIAKPEEEIAIEPESEVVEGKLDKLQTQISEEMAHETKEEIIDIWGDRDTSPPLRIQPIAKPEEEIAIEPESEVVEGKLDKLQIQISEEMAHETKEEIIDIWGGRDTSPPLRIQPIAKPEEEIAIEPESEVVEGKLDKLQTQISEEMAHETKEEDFDIWGDRDTSPPLRIQPIAKPEEEIATEPESEVAEGKLDKPQTQISEEMAHETMEEELTYGVRDGPETIEAEIDIWGDRDTSPPLRIQPIAKPEEEIAIETESEVVEGKLDKLQTQISEEMAHETIEEEIDIWGDRDTSPPLRIQPIAKPEEEIATEPESEVAEGKLDKPQTQISEEMAHETMEEEIDIWGDRDTSPPLRIQPIAKPEEEIAIETESEVVEGKLDKLQTQISEEMAHETIEAEIDIWGDRDTSPPLRIQPIAKPEEEIAIETESEVVEGKLDKLQTQISEEMAHETIEAEIDIWGDRDTFPPLRIQPIAKPEEEIATEPESEVVEGKLDKLQTQISEEMAHETMEEEIDIWGDRDTSPPLRIQPIAKPEVETAIEPESEVAEGKLDKLQTQISEEMAHETIEEEIDIWGDRDTSPPLRIQPIAKPEDVIATEPESEVVEGKLDKLQTQISEEMTHETMEEEIDIWGDRDTSPPLRIQPIAKPEEEIAIEPESEVVEGKLDKLQTQISEEMAHETIEEEIDIWGDRDTSPPLRIQPIAKPEEEIAIEPESEVVEGKLDKLQTQISEEMAHETIEEEIDIWGDRDTSPPLRIQPIAKPEEEIAIEPESEVVEGKVDKLPTQISEEMPHETKEEEIDIWGDRDTSPPLRIQPIAKPEEVIAIEPEFEVVEDKEDKLQTQISEEMAHETKEEEIDIWGGRDTSPPLRIQPIAKPEEETAIEPESEVAEGKLDKLQTQISEEMDHESIEEEIDIWGDRDTSPPLRIQPIAKTEEETAIEPEFEVVEGKEDKLQTQISEEMVHETKEAEIDIWGGRDTSPPLRIQPIAKPEEETAIEPESEVVDGKVDKLQTQISEEVTHETKEAEIDIWGDRDTSPPLRIQPIAKPEDETAIEPESEVVEGKLDKLQTQISEEIAHETKEEEIDIWGERDTSPPLRIQPIAKPEEEIAIEPESEVVEGKADQLQTRISEEMVHETKVEIDIWGDRDTSPPLRIQPIAKPEEETAIEPESEVVEGKADKLQTKISEEMAHETKEVEIDIWGDRDTSPPLRIQPIAKPEEETAIEPESEVAKGKAQKLETEITEEITLETKEEEIDIWGDRDTSPPLRIQPIAKPEEETAIEPESEVGEGKAGKMEIEISEEIFHETKEEIDIWGDRDTSPPLRIQPIAKPEEQTAIELEFEVTEGMEDKLEIEIREELVLETKEEEIDIWGDRDTSPPLRIQPFIRPEEEPILEHRVEIQDEDSYDVVESPETKMAEDTGHESQPEEIDIWADRDTSPPLRIKPVIRLEEETLMESSADVVSEPESPFETLQEPGISGHRDTSPSSRKETTVKYEKEDIGIEAWFEGDLTPPLRVTFPPEKFEDPCEIAFEETGKYICSKVARRQSKESLTSHSQSNLQATDRKHYQDTLQGEGAQASVIGHAPLVLKEILSQEHIPLSTEEPREHREEDSLEEIWSEGSSPPPKKPKFTEKTQEFYSAETSSRTTVGERYETKGYLVDTQGAAYCPEVAYKEPESEEEALIERWFDSDVKEVKVKTQEIREERKETSKESLFIQKHKIVEEKEFEQEEEFRQTKESEEFDIWGAESPPLRSRRFVPFVDEKEEGHPKAPEESPDEGLIDRWFESESKTTKKEEKRTYETEEIFTSKEKSIKQESTEVKKSQEIDIWGGRDTSPPLRISQAKRPGEEVSPSVTPPEETKAKEAEIDIWGGRDISPPLRISQVKRPGEEVSPSVTPPEETKAKEAEIDIWGDRDTSPPLRISQAKRPGEDILPPVTPPEETKAKEAEIDIWGGRDTSPPLRISQAKRPGEEISPTVTPPEETKAKEAEIDIWGDRDTSPPLRISQAKRPGEDISPPITPPEETKAKEAEIDIWGDRDTSPPLRISQAKRPGEEVSPSVTPPKETKAKEAEIDIWGDRDTSPPLRISQAKRPGEEVSPSVTPPEETKAKEAEIDIWGDRDTSPPLRIGQATRPVEDISPPVTPPEETKVKEAEIDIWGDRDTSPPLRISQATRPVEDISPPVTPPEETKAKEAEIDIWGDRDTSPPLRISQAKRPGEEVSPSVTPPEETKAKEAEIDIWGDRDTSPPLRISQAKRPGEDISPPVTPPEETKAKEAEIDIWGDRDTSPPLRISQAKRPGEEVSPSATPPEETKAKEAEIDIWGDRDTSPPLRIGQATRPSVEESSPPVTPTEENKDKEVEIDIWGDRDTSPPLRIAQLPRTEAESPEAAEIETASRVSDEVTDLFEELVEEIKEGEDTQGDFWSERDISPPPRQVSVPDSPAVAKAPSPTAKEEEKAKDKDITDTTQECRESLKPSPAAAAAPEDKKEPPKLTVPAPQQPPKQEVKPQQPARAPLIIPGKMTEPTTPFTPGGTPKPVFTKTLKGEVVEPGESVNFTCVVAHPAPYFVTWLKDNKPLDDKLADRVQAQDNGDKHTLKVMNCRVQDSGIYTAKATDENGISATCSAQLLVQELTEEERLRRIAEKSPFFLVRMKKTEVIENTNLSYTIHVKGDPMPEVQFFKDDKELKEDERVVIHRDQEVGHYELLISHVTRDDEATYKAIAKNKFGRAECEALMTVRDEEAIYESLSGKGSLLAKGEKAEFKWFRDGVEYDPSERFNVMFKDDEDTLALVFQNVTPEDAGLYTCVASTSCGKISCSAELTVEGAVNRLMREPEAPNFKEELQNVQVAVGGSAMLECKVGGFPKPDLKWSRNGMDVKVAGRFKVLWEDEESVALIIKNVEESDAGLYAVKAKNDLGEAQTMAQLNIKAGPKIVRMRKDVSCVIGKDLDYTIEVFGEPPPDVKWLKDGKPLPESNRIKFQKESDTTWTMHMKSMEMDDCACYTVVVANSMGQVSDVFNIETDAAPQIVRGLDPETDKKKGYDVILEVRASGAPRPEARWFKDGKELMSDGDKYKMTKEDKFYMLKIRNVDRKDKGTYKVELTNPSGSVSSETVLNVRAPPDFVTPLKDAYAKEGSKDVKLFVEWEATPKASVKWIYKDKVIHEDTPGYTIRGTDNSQVLTIHEAIPDFVGAYSFRATNEYGESVCTAKFLLHEVPVLTSGLSDTEFLEGRVGQLTFKATGIPPPEIKWTKDGKKWTPDGKAIKLKQEGPDTYTLYFDECTTEDSGHYVATISNVEGTVTTEANVVVNNPVCFSGLRIFRYTYRIQLMTLRRKDPKAFHSICVPLFPVAERPSVKDVKPSKETASIQSQSTGDHVSPDNDSDSGQKDVVPEEEMALDQSEDTDMDAQTADSGKRKRESLPDLESAFQVKREKTNGNVKYPEISDSKETVIYASQEESEEVNIDNDRETCLKQKMNVTVTEEVRNQEIETDSEPEDEQSLIVYGSCDVTSEESKGKGGLRVLAECSIVRQENFQQTVLTAESDVGDGAVESSSIIHLKKTVEVEEYKALISDSDEEGTSDLEPAPALQDASAKPALLMGKTTGIEPEQAVETTVCEPGRSDLETLDIRTIDHNKKVPEVQDVKLVHEKATESPGKNSERKKSKPESSEIKRKSVALDDAPEKCLSVDAPTASKASVSSESEPQNIPTTNLQTVETEKPSHSGEKISKDDLGRLVDGRAPPHIKKSNFKEGKTFIAMHKFVLEVEATAVPEATATWYFNGKELSEEEDRCRFNFDGTKYTMERLGSDPEHTGEYKCVLKNKIDSAQETGIVTVKEKEARVRNPLEDVYVIENTDAVLKCQIVGDPIPTIEWLRNGKPLPPSERFQVTEERLAGWHTITITGVTEQDKCTFTVKGKNQHGECETTSRLGILVKPQPGELKDSTVDYGKDLLLNVAIHAFPLPRWTLEGRELTPNGHFEYMRDEDNEVYGLLIKSAVLEDAGRITYTAENKAGNCSGSCTVKVHTEKPNVVANLEHLMHCLEDDATFTFRASGLPLPDCTWKMGDVVVKEDERHVFTFPEPGVYCLTIKDLNMNDYGVVTVLGKSLVGECNSAGKLSQKKMMCEVVEGLENVTRGAEGDDVTLNVKIRASPRPVFEWSKDGDILEASEKIKIEMKKTSYCEATISLTLVDASSIESGQYRLKFSNELNATSVETALIIRPERRKPKVTKKPSDLEIMEKKQGIFHAKITGFPKPEIKWMKEGRQVYPTDIIDMGVTAEGLYYLEFRHVSTEDVGRYTVYAVNDEGQCEAECSLNVVPPPSKPEFIQSLKASKVIMGYPVRLEVQLGGYPVPEVQWLKDGKPIQIDGTHYKQIVEPDGTVILQIDKATEGDMGEITCVAKNPEGDVSSSAKLAVLGFQRGEGYPDGPAKFSEGLRDMTYDEGKNIRLPVGIRGGPVPNMKWYKDGEEIKLDDRVFFTYDGDRAYLEIRPCKGSDAGKYKCVIQNDKGSDETECEVSIRKCFEAPFFTSTFPNQAKLPGREVKMSVKVDAVPKPDLTWFFNGKPLEADGDRIRVRRDGDGQTLLIKDCTYSDSGNYKVVAKNREGEVEHEASLEVSDDVDPTRRAEAPVFLKVMGDQELFEGSNALFKAIVTGRPEPEYKWTKNGGTIIPTNRVIIEKDHDGLIRLTIKNITPSDAGVYQLKVWNEHGEKTCQGKLICETLTSKMKRPVGDEYMGFDRVRRSGVPMPLPDKPMISALSERRATVSWMPYLPTPPCTPVTYQLEIMECPEGEWFTYRTGIRGCSVDVTNLNSKSDYRFRVRVENKYGVSEPSPYVTSFRYKLDLPPISYEPKMDPHYEYKGDGPYVPEGFRISRDYKGNYYAAPRFLKLDHDTQYGLKGFNASIKWYAYGYPTPKLHFTKDGKPLEVGAKTRFTYTQEATGEICLFIERMIEEDIGVYECWVRNEHGQSKQRIRLDLADYPRIMQPLEELHLKANTSGKIMCRISGFPPCQVRWYRDWEPITTGFRFRPSYAEPDTYILNITGAQVKDSGLYSISAANVAGNVHSSCMVHVEEDDLGFFWYGPGGARQVGINSRRGTLEDHYDIGDELGRGTQGVTYHCVEHHTGRNFAAKSMWGKDKLKVWMHMELEMMNLINTCKHIVRLYDAYEGPRNMVLVTEMCGGGDLLYALTQQQYLTEYEVCCYIRQVLNALEYMHDRCIAHLGLNIGDILLTRPNGREIKIGDLSLARQIRINKVQPLDYGMPEFVAPEVAKGEGVTYAADMWAVGVITYLLLSGTSPFRGENDRETLTRVQKGELTFDMEAFSHVSNEAKDFIAKLLIYKADVRMDVKKALLHPWMQMALAEPKVQTKISTDRLRSYYAKFREWYGNASCRRWFRRRPLSSCFTHPSKMVYPPDEVYTPPESPEREVLPEKTDEYDIMHRDYSYELDVIKNESNYQMGPDTYLLQLRDVDFPCRLRSYMKVATSRSPAYAMSVKEHDYDYKAVPVIHERRRFTDIMDEEIDDERRRTSVDKYTSGFIRSRMETCSLDMPKRVKREVAARLAVRDEATAIREELTFGKLPFMREKPESCAITSGQQLTLTCVVTGDPQPVVQWFKNDLILGDSERCKITNEPGKSTLTYEECRDFDTGQYKVVARNTLGQVTHKFRLILGHIPGPCDCPEVASNSDTEVLVRWRPPIIDGGHTILCYHLQKKTGGDTEWQTVHDHINQEFFLVRGLQEDTVYQFRLAAKNLKGWGEFSVATPVVRTAPRGVLKVKMSKSMHYLQQLTESGKTPAELEKRPLDYTKEVEPVKLKIGENAELQVRKYQFMAELSRGRYSSVIKVVRSDDKRHFAAKLIENKDREQAVKLEHEALRSLRHDRIAQLYESYSIGSVTMFIMEPLTGIDILTYLSSKHEYSEQNVATVVLQVLNALSYLHWRGYGFLDLQPDNVVMTTCRRTDVKLVDMGSAMLVSKLGSSVPVNGLLDYIAPEVLSDQKAYPTSDIWSLGVLTYALLAGSSAFKGADDDDTRQNIQYCRYRFEHLSSSTTQEAIRFLMLIFKRDPNKRPTVDDCREHRWLLETDHMVKKRERATFFGIKLREYDESYHKARAASATKSKILRHFNEMTLPEEYSYDPDMFCVL